VVLDHLPRAGLVSMKTGSLSSSDQSVVLLWG
jgi:hypothetical protein